MKSLSNCLLLFISVLFILGCRKEPEYASYKTGFDKLRRPVPEGFTVNSRSYKGEESSSGIDFRKRSDANPTADGSNPFDPKSSAHPDGPGRIDPVFNGNVQNFELFFRQKYKSQMFTITDQSMGLNIYPGAILDGRSIEGMFDPRMQQGISNHIRPITISTSMPVSGSAVARTSLPRPTAERSLLNTALTDLEELNPGGIGAASLQVEIDSFTVYEELKTLYGYNKSVDVFLVNSNTLKQGENHLIAAKSAIKLKFFQHNFTIDTDIPNSYNELFDPTGLDLDTLAGGTIPVYVKSVTYGRMGIMVLESEYTSDKLYNAVYKQLGILKNLIGIDKELTAEENAILTSADIKVKYTGIGRDSDSTIKVNGLTGFVDILTANSTYSKESPGIPVAFQLAYLDTHGLVEAPFQINYGPFDKPFVRLERENVKTKTSSDQFYANIQETRADIHFKVYSNEAGLILSADPPPNFLVFEYTVTEKSNTDDLAHFKNHKFTGQPSKYTITKLSRTNHVLQTDRLVKYFYKAEGVFDQWLPNGFGMPDDGQWPKYQHLIVERDYIYDIVPSDYYTILAP